MKALVRASKQGRGVISSQKSKLKILLSDNLNNCIHFKCWQLCRFLVSFMKLGDMCQTFYFQPKQFITREKLKEQPIVKGKSRDLKQLIRSNKQTNKQTNKQAKKLASKQAWPVRTEFRWPPPIKLSTTTRDKYQLWFETNMNTNIHTNIILKNRSTAC